ncbi:FAD-dependent oxidoreductase [Hyphomicrobium sp.]|uniref:dihydrolipoyl dehydrogenase family protein n=1 Tax=Hyphomicrobium sp. TaxID=82 RepID=UPI0025C59562|nr:FAD-dependent oxidoreductase [Hyphomicrobium sp.]MCC7251070.1 FAD-dependent oxidoreductase [Hyphomicrobium sp.]
MTQSRPASVTAEARPQAAAEPSVALAGEPLATDICVIGAGSGGVAVATMAAAFGRNTVLVEKHRMGGGDLSGSIPSKALVAAARRAHAMRTAAAFGIASVDPQIDHRAVQGHVKGVVSAVAPNETVERYTGLGVRVILGAGRFLDKRTLIAGDYRITARRFIIATGSSPAVPDIPGLDSYPFLTGETIFEVDRKIPHLVVIGAGPIGLELAQAHLRLGSRVTVIDAARALASDDPEATAVVLNALSAEGLDIREDTRVERVEGMSGYVRVHISAAHGAEIIDGSHLLIATGRNPSISDLNLAAAGVKTGPEGIVVNGGLRTSNRRVYAIGDVNGGPRFSHVSSHQADIALRRALFRLPSKFDPMLVPWVTFTDPELAHVGLTEDQARAANNKINVLRWPFAENDRAHAEHQTLGHIKVVTTAKGRILGATIVGPAASELIQIWALAVAQKLHISAVAGYVAAHPTFGEIGKRAALRHYAALPAKANVRKLIDFLARLG